MPIPEDQLKTWSNPGGTANSISAHKSIRNALEAADDRTDFLYQVEC
jgi:hypothetical protein